MAVAAIGFFDGVHLGHRLVLNTLLKMGERLSEPCRVITFWPHPRILFQSDARGFTMLSTVSEREALIRSCGIQDITCVDFTRSFASLTAASYLDSLRSEGVIGIVLGYDNRFGSDGLGTAEIAALARARGFEVEVCPERNVDACVVSSTRIRSVLRDGKVEAAARMLGRFYCISGVVVPGHQKGRTIGFPTANIKPSDPLKCIPGAGVYFGHAFVGGSSYAAMINVSNEGLIEAHLMDFSQDIYGHGLELSFERFLRPEKHFSSFEQLREQLLEDLASCRTI